MPFAGFSDLGLTGPEIGKMLRHVKRYHLASMQDKNPAIAFLHNSYAVGIMDMMRDLASDEEIKRATGTDVKALRKEVHDVQDKLENTAMKAIKKIGIDKLFAVMKT